MARTKLTFDELLRRCQELRAAAEHAEVEFFMYLYEVETHHMKLITAIGIPSFESFLEQKKLCKPGRYRNFVAGMKKIGAERSAELGVDATIEALKVSDAKLDRYSEALGDWREEHGGVYPSRETASDYARKVDPREEVPAAVKHMSELARLRAENQALKARIRELEAEVRDLRRRLASRKGGRSDQPQPS